jgi:hypothetical protein
MAQDFSAIPATAGNAQGLARCECYKSILLDTPNIIVYISEQEVFEEVQDVWSDTFKSF